MIGSPKQATGETEGGSAIVEKPLGQTEHNSWKDPTEHLIDSVPQLVTLHSEPVHEVCVCA